MVPYQMVHAATAVTIPAKPKNADLDWRARSSGVGIVGGGRASRKLVWWVDLKYRRQGTSKKYRMLLLV